jgi:hypothetical protein
MNLMRIVLKSEVPSRINGMALLSVGGGGENYFFIPAISSIIAVVIDFGLSIG